MAIMITNSRSILFYLIAVSIIFMSSSFYGMELQDMSARERDIELAAKIFGSVKRISLLTFSQLSLGWQKISEEQQKIARRKISDYGSEQLLTLFNVATTLPGPVQGKKEDKDVKGCFVERLYDDIKTDYSSDGQLEDFYNKSLMDILKDASACTAYRAPLSFLEITFGYQGGKYWEALREEWDGFMFISSACDDLRAINRVAHEKQITQLGKIRKQCNMHEKYHVEYTYFCKYTWKSFENQISLQQIVLLPLIMLPFCGKMLFDYWWPEMTPEQIKNIMSDNIEKEKAIMSDNAKKEIINALIRDRHEKTQDAGWLSYGHAIVDPKNCCDIIDTQKIEKCRIGDRLSWIMLSGYPGAFAGVACLTLTPICDYLGRKKLLGEVLGEVNRYSIGFAFMISVSSLLGAFVAGCYIDKIQRPVLGMVIAGGVYCAIASIWNVIAMRRLKTEKIKLGSDIPLREDIEIETIGIRRGPLRA